MPNGAECRTARNAERREMPNGADAERRGQRRVCRSSASSGIRRRLAFGVVWHSAPFGIRRRLAFGAVRHLAPFGCPRPMASYCRLLSPSDTSRRPPDHYSGLRARPPRVRRVEDVAPIVEVEHGTAAAHPPVRRHAGANRELRIPADRAVRSGICTSYVPAVLRKSRVVCTVA